MDNIVLIGMPGCGKSTIGVQLAKLTGYGFLDSDIMIQTHEGKLISELIESVGSWGFTKIEEDLNATIDVHHTVIATGGSIIYGEKAMHHLGKIGTVVYLSLPIPLLEQRFREDDKADISTDRDKDIRTIYENRRELYEKYADLQVEVGDVDDRQAAKRIAGILKERGVL